ncbi:MAG: hypothetical protein AMJ54_00485 [Deltaproteobacteria bacterium SG8_13]|nr:MAG: hypothetical protein AMJ54_00485 [Deltaproteobacteria bacterium SG8_13]
MTRTRIEPSAPQCQRCGTCCKKGGPALHKKDRVLVESGRLPLTDLFTIRRGELARDNVRGTLQPLDTEIVKIKAREAASWTCRYYSDHDSACRIYSTRPLECRVLQCWDTREIERLYSVGRLRRKDLLVPVEGLWDLIVDHDRRCSYESLHRLTRRLKSGGGEADAGKVLEVIQYDAELRDLVNERGNLDPEMLDFLFGRPLTRTVGQFGIRVECENGKVVRLVVERSVDTGGVGNPKTGQ